MSQKKDKLSHDNFDTYLIIYIEHQLIKNRIEHLYSSTYTVMQSDGNNFCGDVVSYSFKKASRDEDNLLYQIYKSKYVRTIIMMILILYNIIQKCLLTLQKHENQIFPCFNVLYFFKY